jgi:hypothetical protein
MVHQTVQDLYIYVYISIDASSGNRTHVPSIRACEDNSCLRRTTTVVRTTNVYYEHTVVMYNSHGHVDAGIKFVISDAWSCD